VAKDETGVALKRETAGRYRSADGRFTVESQGANDWYVADEEQVDQLGQPVLRGPYPSLAEAREAVAEARAKPVVGRALPRVKTTPGEARPPRAAAKPQPQRDDGKATATSKRASAADAKLPKWLADIDADRRTSAKQMANELAGLGVDDPEQLVADDFRSDEPLIAEVVLARRLRERLGSDKDVGAVLDILRDEGFRPGAGRPPFGWRLIELDRQGRPTQRRLRVKRER
jgi:hypothetical protein